MLVRGLRPLAIPSIVSFESESSSVLTTHTSTACAEHHVQVRARVVEIVRAAFDYPDGSCGAERRRRGEVRFLHAPELVAPLWKTSLTFVLAAAPSSTKAIGLSPGSVSRLE